MLIIIVVAVIAIIAIAALLVMKSKKGKAPEPKKTSTTSQKPTAQPVEDKPVAAKPKVDLENLISKVNVLIGDKQYGNAESTINQALNKDKTIPDLYFKLFEIYQLQDDEFAIKKLLTTVQELNLNEVYQQLYSDYEAYKVEKEKRAKAEAAKKAPESYDFTPSSTPSKTETVVEKKSEQNNTLAFDQLSLDETSPVQETKAPEQGNTLEFSLSTAPTEAKSSHTAEAPTLEFTLNEPTTTVETTAPTLDFSLSSETTTEHQPTLTVEENIPVIEDVITETFTTHADINDPIAQAFPILQDTNPTDIDIDLAEQYIRFGEFNAAKNILNIDPSQLSGEQSARVNQLLQKIAS